MAKESLLPKLFTLCQKHGYLTPIISNQNIVSFNCGPLGIELNQNIVNEWWNSAVRFANIPVFPVSAPLTKLKEKTSIASSLIYSTLLNHYQLILNLTGGRLPFGIAQTVQHANGAENNEDVTSDNAESLDNIKAWSPKEWTELNLSYFCSPKKPFAWLDHWQKQRLTWWRKFSGNPSDLIVTDITQNEDNTHELKIQYKFPWGTETIEKLINFGSLPFNALKEEKGMDFNVKDGRKIVIPHLITCESYLNLAMMMYLVDGYQEKESVRQVMRLHYTLVPYKVTIAILTNSGNTVKLRDLAEFITKQLRKTGITIFLNPDLNTRVSLDIQFSRFDEMGIQYSIVLNDTTLSTGIVGLRNRDTTLREQVHISELKKSLMRYLKIR